LVKRVSNQLLIQKTTNDAIQTVVGQARSEPYFVGERSGAVHYLLIEPESDTYIRVESFEDAITAMQHFVRISLSRNDFLQYYKRLEQQIVKLSRSVQLKIESLETSQRKLERRRSDEELGHLLMANLHAIQSNADQIEVHDFYRDENLIIELDARLNPQENAAAYYRKHRNRQGKSHHQNIQLEELKTLQLEIQIMEADWAEVKTRKDLKEFERQYKPFLQQESVQQAAILPFREYILNGHRIWVGRNSKSNDELTFRYARKFDLWLHAKDVPGSHVLIRRMDTRQPPLAVIEYAAALAAWFSKNKHNTVVPVSMTERRYVRKGKRMLVGQVGLLREEVILIEPAPPHESSK